METGVASRCSAKKAIGNEHMGDPLGKKPAQEERPGPERELTADEAEAFARQFKAIWEKSQPAHRAPEPTIQEGPPHPLTLSEPAVAVAPAAPPVRHRSAPGSLPPLMGPHAPGSVPPVGAPRPQDITPRGLGPVRLPHLLPPEPAPEPPRAPTERAAQATPQPNEQAPPQANKAHRTLIGFAALDPRASQPPFENPVAPLPEPARPTSTRPAPKQTLLGLAPISSVPPAPSPADQIQRAEPAPQARALTRGVSDPATSTLGIAASDPPVHSATPEPGAPAAVEIDVDDEARPPPPVVLVGENLRLQSSTSSEPSVVVGDEPAIPLGALRGQPEQDDATIVTARVVPNKASLEGPSEVSFRGERAALHDLDTPDFRGGGSRKGWLLGVAALIVVVGIGLLLLRGGETSSPPVPTTDPAEGATLPDTRAAPEPSTHTAEESPKREAESAAEATPPSDTKASATDTPSPPPPAQSKEPATQPVAPQIRRPMASEAKPAPPARPRPAAEKPQPSKPATKASAESPPTAPAPKPPAIVRDAPF